MKTRKFQNIVGVGCVVLLMGLLYQFGRMPGGMILPGYYFGFVLLFIAMAASLILTVVVRLIANSFSAKTIFFVFTFLAFLILHYIVYSPTLSIIVPINYSGDVRLILKDTTENDLVIDERGIGYLTPWFFEKTYLPPVVKDSNGLDLSNHCVRFNNNTFWGLGKGPSPDGTGSVRYLTFKIDRSRNGDQASLHYSVSSGSSK